MGMAAARKQEVSLTTVLVKKKWAGSQGLMLGGRGGGIFTCCQRGVGHHQQLLCRALHFPSSLCLLTAIRNTRVRNLLWLFCQSILSSTALSSGVCLHRSGQEAASSAASFTLIPSERRNRRVSLGPYGCNRCVYVTECVYERECVCVCVGLCAM